MNRWVALFVFSVIFLLANGCSQVESGKSQPNEVNKEEVTEQVTEQNEVVENEVVEEVTQIDIHIYFSDQQALELMESSEKITFKNELEKYEKAYLALTRGPSEEMEVLWGEETLDQITFNEGTLTIELDSVGQQTGSSAERLKLLSLLKTMFQFPEVERIQITNQDQETLSGHLDILEPFTREMMAGL